MFFRKAKDETDEFTRIREAVRVDGSPQQGQSQAAPPAPQQPQQQQSPPPPVAPGDDGGTSWVRPVTPGSVPQQAGAPQAPARGDYQVQAQAQTQMPQAGSGGTVLSPEATFEGRLSSEGSIHIQGKVNGEVRTSDTVYVAREARVEATIQAGSVIVAGEVLGDITCSGKLEVIPSGRISGEVDAGRLVIHEGAFVNSTFKMGGKAGATRQSGGESASVAAARGSSSSSPLNGQA